MKSSSPERSEDTSAETPDTFDGPAVVVLRQYEVEESLCIGCGLCETHAPENVELAPGVMHSRVYQQPRTAEEEQNCADAARFCPTGGLHPTD
jgi:ferredoxin